MAWPKNAEAFTERRNFKVKRREDNNFHVAIAPVLAIAQFFGLFPVIRVFSKNAKKIHFKFRSLRTFHSVVLLSSSVIFLYLETIRLYHSNGINPKNINGILFYIDAFLVGFLFFQLSTKWTLILTKFERVDNIFSNSNYTPRHDKWSLKKRVNVFSAIFVLVAITEHLASWSAFIYERIFQKNECKWNIDNWFFYIATTHLSHVYEVFPVRYTTTLWAEYVNIAFTFAWNFADLFIIITSISLVFKFETINYRLEQYKGRRNLDGDYWEDIRFHYNEVCELQELIDNKIGNIICVASLNDLYFITLQLLNAATPFPFFINYFYFWWSLVCLLFRTFSMFFISSAVHEESKKPLKVLRHVPNDGWFEETQRFSSQVQSDCYAMTGRKFFKLTRGLIITIAGTILTYELVLLQFDADKIITGLYNPCPTNIYVSEMNGTNKHPTSK